jgi:DNA-binding transcriptional ArsR family regulator
MAESSSRDHAGKASYPIPIWNGIFDHRRKIASAVWVFLWCIDRVTKEESEIGFVLGGSIITARRIADELDDSQRTVRRHLERLAENEYIALKRLPYGFVIKVMNSCKFNIWRSDKAGHPEWTKVPARSDKSAALTAKIVRSNKEDTAVDLTERQKTFIDQPVCLQHPESGRTNWGTCWQCYAEKYSSTTHSQEQTG